MAEWAALHHPSGFFVLTTLIGFDSSPLAPAPTPGLSFVGPAPTLSLFGAPTPAPTPGLFAPAPAFGAPGKFRKSLHCKEVFFADIFLPRFGYTVHSSDPSIWRIWSSNPCSFGTIRLSTSNSIWRSNCRHFWSTISFWKFIWRTDSARDNRFIRKSRASSCVWGIWFSACTCINDGSIWTTSPGSSADSPSRWIDYSTSSKRGPGSSNSGARKQEKGNTETRRVARKFSRRAARDAFLPTTTRRHVKQFGAAAIAIRSPSSVTGFSRSCQTSWIRIYRF
jgi:hypothetical protein